ncbi:hypothetical protein FA341_14785 [Pseudomonas aeruginosa]|uniref:Uncharacterized protein n=4 Tax=Pseudomonadaceae TaxID=135621 RepID=A0A921NHQ6_9PSED|nr:MULTISPECIES: hypothetical protein [Pseudomonas]KEX94886.1 hypothetical protein HA62_04440 [Pseudomonas putida]EIU2642857.1 hypothetical protein [Pseudomonas aeruginosa]EIU9543890.1 hypothetical protein [Pseudomonas aeruginosa]EIU9551113.1 hypothetical protein [Pseudomonas aeruginosa]EJY6032560.1 hypothetical protein [Pseudomonas aeruginosa]
MAIDFKLVIKLATPFVMSRPRTTLDGLLSAAVFRETGLMGGDTIPHIPLEREDGIFKGSCAFVSGGYTHATVQRIMNLRGLADMTDEHFAPNSKGKVKRYLGVDIKRGPYKANMSSYAGIDAKTVIFFGKGDPDRVVELIKNNIPGLGRRANAGAGEIIDVSWVKVSADRDCSWIMPSGSPARPLPLDVWNRISGHRKMPVADLTVRVPYWSGEAVQAVYPMDTAA